MSNINQILNGGQNGIHQVMTHTSPSGNCQSNVGRGDKVLEDIDKVLMKVQKSGNMPTKSL